MKLPDGAPLNKPSEMVQSGLLPTSCSKSAMTTSSATGTVRATKKPSFFAMRLVMSSPQRWTILLTAWPSAERSTVMASSLAPVVVFVFGRMRALVTLFSKSMRISHPGGTMASGGTTCHSALGMKTGAVMGRAPT